MVKVPNLVSVRTGVPKVMQKVYFAFNNFRVLAQRLFRIGSKVSSLSIPIFVLVLTLCPTAVAYNAMLKSKILYASTIALLSAVNRAAPLDRRVRLSLSLISSPTNTLYL